MTSNLDHFESERIYHIYSKAIGKEVLFLNEDNYSYFLAKYGLYTKDMVDTLAYCLLPNHFHFLIKIKKNVTNEKLIRSFSNLLNAYSKAFNKANNRSGGLFQRKFKRKLVEDENYFSRIVLYIHLNPIKHSVARDISDWKYSSFRGYLSSRPTKLKKDLVLDWFGGIQEFEKIHRNSKSEYLPEALSLE